MAEVKICPILSTAKHLLERMGTNNNLIFCQQVDCAWWDKDNECCSMSTKSTTNVDARVQVVNS
jgi:hypothetical protein